MLRSRKQRFRRLFLGTCRGVRAGLAGLFDYISNRTGFSSAGGQPYFGCCFDLATAPLPHCRYWAIAIPSAIFVTWSVAVLVYIAVNFMSTAPLDSFDTITGINVPP